jgi:hypothetical protein
MEDGRRVAAGVYFVRLSGGDGAGAARVVIVR